MSLFVNTDMIEETIKKLDMSIKKYEDNSYDFFYELSKLDSYWKDDNYLLFNEKLKVNKNDNLQIIENLEKISNFYKYAENAFQKYKNGE